MRLEVYAPGRTSYHRPDSSFNLLCSFFELYSYAMKMEGGGKSLKACLPCSCRFFIIFIARKLPRYWDFFSVERMQHFAPHPSAVKTHAPFQMNERRRKENPISKT